MYTPSVFKELDEDRLLACMEAWPFATMIMCHSNHEPEIAHLPVLVVREGTATKIVGHLARANKMRGLFDGERPATLIFNGPHGYISPLAYRSEPQVPTWNYAVVHARGRPVEIVDPDRLEGILRKQIQQFETPDGFAMDGLPSDFLESKTAAITGFEMTVQSLVGKFKLSQNKSKEDCMGAVNWLKQRGEDDLADLMLEGS